MHRTLCLLLLLLPNLLPAAEPLYHQQTLFEAGKGGYAVYRIPSLVCTEKGTLLAFCEARKSSSSDWGAIDILYRRGTNGGKTWSEPKLVTEIGTGFEKNPVASKQKLGKTGEITVNNPLAIVDGPTVHFLYCIEYMRCFYCRSDDDGLTFSRPVEITSTFDRFRPEYDWKVLATGPGHGIAHSKTGRLIVPVWLSTGTGGHAHRPSAVATIYSDDHGKTWQRGDLVVNHPELTNPSETAIVEMADGRVMLNIRHESPTFKRAIAISADGATKWSKPKVDEALPEPVCMGSLIRFDPKTILFSNPHNTDGRERKNVSVHLSSDDGQTWSHRRALESGLSGYSDLAVGPQGLAYCFYERGEKSKSLALATFNEAWMKAKPIRILALGDSITKGYRAGVPEEATFAAQLQQILRKNHPTVEVLNAGIGSETTALARKRFAKAVLDQKPDIVLIMYGANDCYTDKGKTTPRVAVADYRANLQAMIEQLKKAGIQPVLMTTNHFGPKLAIDGSGQHPNVAIEPYMTACRELAKEMEVPLIDHQRHWQQTEQKGTDLASWMTDQIHPNPQGHAELTQEMLPAIEKLLKKR
jgi:sialidase-1